MKNTKSIHYKIFPLLSLIVIALQSPLVSAASKEDLKKSADAACSRIEMCIKKQMSEDDDFPSHMMPMIESMIKQSCAHIYHFNQQILNDETVDQVVACFDAMAEQSCDAFENGDQPKECDAIEENMDLQ